MKRKSEKMRTALRAVALVLLLGAGLGQLAAQSLPDGKAGKNTREEEKPFYLNKTVNEDGDLLTLEAYVKGKTIGGGEAIPLDICLVIDCSRSMMAEKVTLTHGGYYPYFVNSLKDANIYQDNEREFKYISSRDFTYTHVNSNGPFYYPYVDETGQMHYCRVVAYKQSGTKYYLYFDYGSNRYYLKDKTVTMVASSSTPPTSCSVSLANKAIWTGGGFYKEYAAGSQITRMAAMQGAVTNFLASLKQNAYENRDVTTGVPVDHRVSLVRFCKNGWPSGQNESSIDEGDHTSFTYPSSTSINPEIVVHAPSELLKNFKDVYNNYSELALSVYSQFASENTATNYGVTKAKYVMATNNPSYNPDHKKMVIVFTDGYPQVSSDPGFDYTTANAALLAAKNAFKDGNKADVYSIGFFSNSSSQEAKDMVAYLSSTYPQATSMSSPGTPVNKLYWFTSNDPEGLNDVFQHIAEEAVPGVQWGNATIVQDVMSEYFEVPENVEASGISVLTAACNGEGEGGDENGFTFAGPEESGLVAYFHNGDRTKIRVNGFDFSDNWVGKVNGVYRGKKLIINIPIQPKQGIDPGLHPTNDENSTIFPNGEEDQAIVPGFHKPKYYIKGATWVEAIVEDPGDTHIKFEDGAYHIYTKEGLAWFISIVCGYNGEPGNPAANAVLEADVDMLEGQFQKHPEQGTKRLMWVPIGGYGYCKNFEEDDWEWHLPNTHGYHGTFDGQGHVIRNMRNPDPVSIPQGGMFGYVDGGEIRNVFIVNSDFLVSVGKDSSQGFCTGTEGHFGILADTLCNGGIIRNCEVAGVIKTYGLVGKMYDDTEQPVPSPLQDPAKCYIGGLVGLVGRDINGDPKPATIHSCISVANMMGYGMGGSAYEIETGSEMKNCYDYTAHLSWLKNYSSFLGGLVAKNAGTVENCYLRDRDNCVVQDATLTGIFDAVRYAGSDKSRDDWHKGLLAGLNNGTMTRIYVPEPWKNCPAIDVTNDLPCFVGYQSQAAQNVGWFTNAVTPYLYKHNDTKISMLPDNTLGDRLLQTLNAWVDSHAGCTHWMRTTAAGINDDYPVLKLTESNFPSCECVASDDQIVLFYGGINEMLGSRELMTDDKENASIYLYKSVALTEGDNGAKLYIDENVAVTQTENVNAYVGITLDNSAGINGANANNPNVGFVMDAIDWHMFATSLSNAPLGINYIDEGTSWPFSDTHGNMPYYRFFDESDGLQEHDGYFPSHIFGTEYGNGDPYVDNNGVDYYHAWDFYCWDEYSQHYINFKRNSDSHWTEGQDLNSGNLHQQIEYTNESTLKRGKGYLLAVADETFLQSHGKLNNGSFTHDVTYNENPFCKGYNLVGNPYQSYLDFDVFAETNGLDGYVIMDEDQADEQGKNAYLYYAKNSTTDPDLQFINMHQGFFIKVNENQTLTFTNDMRSLTANEGTHFRNESKKAYPYLRLFVSEDEGYGDYTTIEFNRPELGGGEKFTDLRAGNAQIFVHHGETSYSTLFATNDIKEVAVRFNTLANANFTMSWKFSEGDFNEMYLIDNLTGQKIDMLSHNEYKFEGHVSDYASRFKVVFATNGIDEETDEPDIFAFQMDGKLIVNGTGICQMFDVTGRLVFATELSDVRNALALPKTGGVYMLRLVNGNTAKVQKIVVK